LDGETFFTGRKADLVKEIEVFEIIAIRVDPVSAAPQAQVRHNASAAEPPRPQSAVPSAVERMSRGLSRVATPLPPPRPVQSDKSVIVADLAAFAAPWGGKVFKLLWRGSRDGFKAWDFHARCDRTPNTLTIIKDKGGNVFGGFTPVPWESRDRPRYEIADPSYRSFTFAFPQPGAIRPLTFPIRRNQYKLAIFSRSTNGPRFWVPDILLANDCQQGSNHCAEGGRVYAIDKRIPFMNLVLSLPVKSRLSRSFLKQEPSQSHCND
jgi:hypothetical protein